MRLWPEMILQADSDVKQPLNPENISVACKSSGPTFPHSLPLPSISLKGTTINECNELLLLLLQLLFVHSWSGLLRNATAKSRKLKKLQLNGGRIMSQTIICGRFISRQSQSDNLSAEEHLWHEITRYFLSSLYGNMDDFTVWLSSKRGESIRVF